MKSPPFILCEPPLSGIPPFYPTQTRGVRSCSACSHAYREAPVRWTGASFFCQFCGGIRGGQSRPPLRRSYGAKRCHCEERSDAAIRSQRGAAALTGRRGGRPPRCAAGEMLVLRRDTWVPPYRVRREYGAGRVVRPSFQFSVPSFRSNSAWMRRRSTACSGAVRRGSAAIRVWAASRASARSGISQLRSAAFSVGRPC